MTSSQLVFIVPLCYFRQNYLRIVSIGFLVILMEFRHIKNVWFEQFCCDIIKTMPLYNRALFVLQLISHSHVYPRTMFVLLNYLHVFCACFGNVTYT